VTGVQTDRGAIDCNTVVIAAGTWSHLIKHAPRVPIEPVHGQMVCLQSKPQLTRHVIFSPRGYIVPRHDGRLLAGSTSERIGFERAVTAGGVTSILLNAQEISPAIMNLPLVDAWSGLRPCSADGLPVLGPCDEIDGLFYATGHYRNGILLAPVTGELISAAITEGRTSPLLTPFRAARFLLRPVG
jgi:glycine oxidase